MAGVRFSGARVGLGGALALLAASAAVAGPPYLTDDPDPVPYHHWELYTFMTQDVTRGAKTLNGPALELNNGVAPNTQLHLIIPQTFFSTDGMRASGSGDTELGVKYRFLAETGSRPEVGMFPLLELPTGDASRGLGNGRTYVKVPVWLEKNMGPWTSYGGGGYDYNTAPGQRNYFYGGLLVQRTLSPKLTLGGEIFAQGAQVKTEPGISDGITSSASSSVSSSGIEVSGSRASTLWNFGGSCNFTPDFSFIFSAGHSFEGEGNRVLYLGLYRTWGPGYP